MDSMTTTCPLIEPNKDRVRRASSWVEKQLFSSSTAAKRQASLRKAEDDWEKTSTTTSMEAQMDAEDLAARKDYMRGEEKAEASEADLLEAIKPQSKINQLLIAYMGCGVGHADTDSCRIITEPKESLIDEGADDFHLSAESSSIHPLGSAGIESEAYQINHQTEPYRVMTRRRRLVKPAWPPIRYQTDHDSWSESKAPSLAETARSTIASIRPVTPPTYDDGGRSQRWLGDDSPQFEEPLPVLHSEHPGCEIDAPAEMLENCASKMPDDYEFAALSISLPREIKARRHNEISDSVDDGCLGVDLYKGLFDELFQAVADEENWRVRVEHILRPSLIRLPTDHVYFKLRNVVLDRLEAEFNKCHPGQSTSGRKMVTFESPNSQGAFQGISRALGKRQVRDDEDENDNGDPSSSPPNKKPKEREPDSRYLACPYYKRNMSKYDTCIGHRLRNIKAVKQHLERQHLGPQHYCPTCFQQFRSRNEADMHIRTRTCQPGTQRVEGMSADQAQEIGIIAASRKRMGEQERWFRMFEVLFPGAPKPTSAYIARGPMEVLSHIQTFMRGPRGQLIMSDFYRVIGTELYEGVSVEDLRHDFATQLIRDLFGGLNDELENPPEPNLRSSNSNFSSSTSMDRSSLGPTTNATTVDNDDPLNTSNTLPSEAEEPFCFGDEQIDTGHPVDQDDTALSAMGLPGYSPLGTDFDFDALLNDVQEHQDNVHH